MLAAREFNRRIKAAVTALRAAGAKRLAVDILPDGGARVIEASEGAEESEAERLGRLIEEKLGHG